MGNIDFLSPSQPTEILTESAFPIGALRGHYERDVEPGIKEQRLQKAAKLLGPSALSGAEIHLIEENWVAN